MSTLMKLAMIGNGRMGTRITGLAPQHGFETSLVLGEHNNVKGDGISASSFSGVDAAIDFTHPNAAMTHIRRVLQTGTPLVVGTTGWLTEANRETIERLIKTYDGRLVYGSNFSLGVQLFMKLAREAGRLLGNAPGFDASLHEVHHTGKADAPSGTAITTAGQFLAGAGKKRQTSYGVPERGLPDTDSFRISSQRLGDVFGEHQLRIQSEWDDIALSHRALSRDGFAAGALKTAAWLTKQEPGFYLIENVVEEVLSSES